MLKIQLNNSNHRRIEFTEKSSHSHQEWQIVETLVSDSSYVEINYKALKADGK